MRGGSSKGIYFHLADLPQDISSRDYLLKWVMGAYGDPRQIDGLGGADPLTSKIAIVTPSQRDDSDIDYSFVQALVGEDGLDDTPNCGNILSGIGAFAVETGLIKPVGDQASIRVYMTNSGNRCLLQFPLENGFPIYHGEARIDGVFGSSAPVMCHYQDLEGSACGSLFPTGKHCNEFDDVRVTCIDNGMPVVCLRGEDFGLNGSSYKLSSKQAQAILDLRLQRLTGLEQDNLIKEYEEVLQDIAALNEILENPERLQEVIEEELIFVKEEFGDQRKTPIEDKLDLSTEDLIKPETKFIDLPKSITCAGFPIREYDKKIPSDLTVEQILVRSGNIGSVKIAQKVGSEKFKLFLEKVGVLSDIDFDLSLIHI